MIAKGNDGAESPSQATGLGDHWRGYPILLMACLSFTAMALLTSFDWRLGLAYIAINLQWAIDSSFKYNRTYRPN